MWSLSPQATKNWFGRGGTGTGLSLGFFVLLALWSSLNATWACETPVYRYAMYRWQPTPYEVYAFHDDAHATAHAAVEAAIIDVSEKKDNRANVVFIPVNVTTDPELNGVTPDIKAAWNSQEDRALPSFLISTPYGVQIYSGELTAATVTDLVESPARKQMAQLLEAGKIGVFLFLGGKDEKQNEQTRQILRGLVKEVGEGKISLYTAPTGDTATEGEEKEDASNPGLELGLIEVNRDDDKETWLVRSLLAMESDLPDEARPMVFLTYGRGRALLPYIGEGITRENLIHEVEFISGACSCTVKEQNPGVDLLVRYDWDAASAALADRFGTEEGNESQFGPSDFLPQLIIPSSVPPVADVATTTDAVDVPDATDIVEPNGLEENGGEIVAETDDDIQVEESVAIADPGVGDAGGDDAASAGSSAASTEERVADADVITTSDTDNGDPVEVASVTPPDANAGSVSDFGSQRTYSGMLVVGGGLALGLVILFGLTFFVMRPH